jgi:N-acetylmuramoyl-L-alanine amidase
MKKNKIIVIAMFLVLANFACQFPAFSQNIPTVNVDGVSYIDVDSYSKEIGLRYLWDPITKNAVVSGENGQVRFHVGSEFILSREALADLGNKTRFFKGAVMAPLPAADYLKHLSVEKKVTVIARAPTAPALPAVQARPLPAYRVRTIVIDAGHGGFDTGAVSPRFTREKDLVLDIAKRVKKLLESQGVQVIMTRDVDVFVPLAERARIANQKRGDLFVSIHANASFTRSLRGLEIYHLSEATDDQALALERAEDSVLQYETAVPGKDVRTILWDLKESENRKESIRVADEILNSIPRATPVYSTKLRAANFYVLKWTECPSILIETGYVTNRQDENRLRSSIYRQHLAEGIVKGLMNYKNDFDRTNGFTR